MNRHISLSWEHSSYRRRWAHAGEEMEEEVGNMSDHHLGAWQASGDWSSW